MIPLDVTHQLVTTAPRLAALRALPNRCGAAFAALLVSFERNRRAKSHQITPGDNFYQIPVEIKVSLVVKPRELAPIRLAIGSMKHLVASPL